MTTTPNTTADESPMFAPIPSWERNKKRGFGSTSRAAAEPRSFAPVEREAYLETNPEIDRVSQVDPANTAFAAAPVYATRTQAKSSSAPVAIAAGLILIGGMAAAGWYYTQPHGQTAVAELTPSAATTTTTSETATAPVAASAQTQMAKTAPAPVTVKTKTTMATTRTASVSRTRAPAASSRAAVDHSANASATAPMRAPTPSVAPPAAAATPAPPLVLNIPPAAAAPQTVTPQAAPQPTEVPQA
jgi:hypothetical protein